MTKLQRYTHLCQLRDEWHSARRRKDYAAAREIAQRMRGFEREFSAYARAR